MSGVVARWRATEEFRMRDPDRMSDDGGAIPLGIDARHFTGTGAGIGPAVNVNLPMLGRTVSLTAKALFDIDSHNRFDALHGLGSPSSSSQPQRRASLKLTELNGRYLRIPPKTGVDGRIIEDCAGRRRS
jgi:hypothetical protein